MLWLPSQSRVPSLASRWPVAAVLLVSPQAKVGGVGSRRGWRWACDRPVGSDAGVTLLIGLKGKDGLVLAADSRGTFGDPRMTTAQNDSQQKAHVLAAHVAVLVAGSGEVGAKVIAEAKSKIDSEHLDGVTPVTEALREVARDCYARWFPSLPAIPVAAQVQTGQAQSRPDLGFVIGGYDGAGPNLVSLPSGFDFPPMLHTYGWAVMGVPQYALYLLNRLYEADRTVRELVPLAVYAITETAGQDGKVGGPVHVITIDPGETGCQVLDADAVAAVQAANASRLQALRDSFYERT
jgi:20S proteasome alpha/beta subunit